MLVYQVRKGLATIGEGPVVFVFESGNCLRLALGEAIRINLSKLLACESLIHVN